MPTVRTAGGGTTVANANLIRTGFGPDPQFHGIKGWTYDPGTLNSNGRTFSAGILALVAVPIPVTATITSVNTYVIVGGATLTAGQNLVGLYSSSGTLLTGSPDQTTAWASAGPNVIALTTPQSVTGGPSVFVWVGFLFNGTTGPQIICNGGSTASANIGLSAANTRFGHYGTAQTALPTITPASIVQDGNNFWVGLT